MTEAREPRDEDLVRRIRDGDEAAAATLFDRHLPKLRATVRRRLPAALRAKVGESDVIQEAYLAAFLRLTRFEDRGDGSFEAWLRRILEHKLLHAMRRHGEVAKRDARREVRLATEARDGARAVAGRQRTPSAEVVRNEESVAMDGFIDELTEDHRTVIRLVHQEGLTLVEAGARMGRSADAVRKLYGRALERLGERLGDAPGTSV